jgi:hypothetical protein
LLTENAGKQQAKDDDDEREIEQHGPVDSAALGKPGRTPAGSAIYTA